MSVHDLVNEARMEKLCKLVVEEPLLVEAILRDEKSKTEMGVCLARIFVGKPSEKRFLKDAIRFEIHSTEHPELLLRETTVPVAIIMESTRIHSQRYMQKKICPSLSSVLNDRNPCEIDPNKADPNSDDLSKNEKNILKCTEAVLQAVYSSAKYVPIIMREIFRGLFYETSVKFTDAKYKVLSGYFFLRLVCPALSAAPLQNILPEQRRKLILVAKLIQFIANGNQTSEKESFLNTPSISDFLHRHSDLMVLFFDKILNNSNTYFNLSLRKEKFRSSEDETIFPRKLIESKESLIESLKAMKALHSNNLPELAALDSIILEIKDITSTQVLSEGTKDFTLAWKKIQSRLARTQNFVNPSLSLSSSEEQDDSSDKSSDNNLFSMILSSSSSDPKTSSASLSYSWNSVNPRPASNFAATEEDFTDNSLVYEADADTCNNADDDDDDDDDNDDDNDDDGYHDKPSRSHYRNREGEVEERDKDDDDDGDNQQRSSRRHHRRHHQSGHPELKKPPKSKTTKHSSDHCNRDNTALYSPAFHQEKGDRKLRRLRKASSPDQQQQQQQQPPASPIFSTADGSLPSVRALKFHKMLSMIPDKNVQKAANTLLSENLSRTKVFSMTPAQFLELGISDKTMAVIQKVAHKKVHRSQSMPVDSLPPPSSSICSPRGRRPSTDSASKKKVIAAPDQSAAEISNDPNIESPRCGQESVKQTLKSLPPVFVLKCQVSYPNTKDNAVKLIRCSDSDNRLELILRNICTVCCPKTTSPKIRLFYSDCQSEDQVEISSDQSLFHFLGSQQEKTTGSTKAAFFKLSVTIS